MEVRRLTPDELQHHGVKGMRWGVRRYQNYDGTLTVKGEARLEKYRSKEMGILTKRSNKEKNDYDKRVTKLKDKVQKEDNDKKKEKLNKKIEQAKASYKAGKAITDSEIKAIGKYKLADFEREKSHVNSYATAQAINTLISIPVAMFTGVIFVSSVPSAKQIKTSDRLNFNKDIKETGHSMSSAARQISNSKSKNKAAKLEKQMEKDIRKYGRGYGQ